MAFAGRSRRRDGQNDLALDLKDADGRADANAEMRIGLAVTVAVAALSLPTSALADGPTATQTMTLTVVAAPTAPRLRHDVPRRRSAAHPAPYPRPVTETLTIAANALAEFVQAMR